VVGPRAKREAVPVARKEGKLSERRACGLIGMNRGSWRYQWKARKEAALRARLRELAGERPRFGYRRLHQMLRREKWVVNHKRVYRLYREVPSTRPAESGATPKPVKEMSLKT
jgi:putative transposase